MHKEGLKRGGGLVPQCAIYLTAVSLIVHVIYNLYTIYLGMTITGGGGGGGGGGRGESRGLKRTPFIVH